MLQLERADQPQHRQRHRWDAHHSAGRWLASEWRGRVIGPANYALQGSRRRVRFDASGSGGRGGTFNAAFRLRPGTCGVVPFPAPRRPSRTPSTAPLPLRLRSPSCRRHSIACAGRGHWHGMAISLARSTYVQVTQFGVDRGHTTLTRCRDPTMKSRRALTGSEGDSSLPKRSRSRLGAATNGALIGGTFRCR